METDPNQPEIKAVADFLKNCLPFDLLDDGTLNQTARQIKITYYRHGSVINVDDHDVALRLVRSGAVEIRSNNNQLMDRLGEGESFNIHGLEMGNEGVKALVIEDSLIYSLPRVHYEHLRSTNRDFDRHFHSQRSRRLRRRS